MFYFPVSRSPRPRTQPRRGCGQCRQTDEAEIRIGDVVVAMTRRSNLDVPAEFSAYIPRAEIRRRFQDGRLSEEEIILSSITIVHSPRHRTEEEHTIVTAPSAVHTQVTETVNPVPNRAGPRPAAPARQWNDRGTWSGIKVAAARTCAPRLTFAHGGKSFGERMVEEDGDGQDISGETS